MNGFIAMIIISALCLLVGILSIKSGIRKKKVCTELAVAKIVDVHVSYGDGHEKNTYSPIYAFEINGQEYKGTIGQVSKKRKDFKIGNEHNIKYNPENPKEFIDADRNATKLNGILFLIMGIVFLAIALGIK